MSRNYYARVIPSKEDKECLKSLIDKDEYKFIEDAVSEVYGEPNYDGERLTYGYVHLGCRCGGWKFLWNPNLFEQRDGYRDESGKFVFTPSSQVTVYEKLDKEHIKAFIDREDIYIIDEYGVKQDKEEFWNMALTWCQPNGYDNDKFCEEEPSSAGILNSEMINFIKSLIKQGYNYKLGKYNADFYSDGLRFCTSNNFS